MITIYDWQNDLTKGEKRVLALVLTGIKNAEIAKLLCVEEGTVKSHNTQIMKKAKIKSRAALMALFIPQKNLLPYTTNYMSDKK